MGNPSPPADLNSFLAGIGHICLQWALLEQTLLGIIAAAENMPLEKTYTRFGTTDMMPRIRMAVRLTEEAKWPPHLRNRLKAIRTALQKENGGLAERRNLFVHGVHEGMNDQGEVRLTMVRWTAENREQVVTILDAAFLANRLGELAQESQSIFSDYGVWKFGPGHEVERRKHIAEAKPITRFVRAQNIKRAVKLLFANLKP